MSGKSSLTWDFSFQCSEVMFLKVCNKSNTNPENTNQQWVHVSLWGISVSSCSTSTNHVPQVTVQQMYTQELVHRSVPLMDFSSQWFKKKQQPTAVSPIVDFRGLFATNKMKEECSSWVCHNDEWMSQWDTRHLHWVKWKVAMQVAVKMCGSLGSSSTLFL